MIKELLFSASVFAVSLGIFGVVRPGATLEPETAFCQCTTGDPWQCGYYEFEDCITTRDPEQCNIDCCDPCLQACYAHCLARSAACKWSLDDHTNCIAGCRKGHECNGCVGPPPPGCP